MWVVANNIREMLCFLSHPIFESVMAPVSVVMRRRERELAWCFFIADVSSKVAAVSSKVAAAIAELVDVFGEGGPTATVAKDGGGGRAWAEGRL